MASEKETVVLLHGILKSSFDMTLMESYLRRQGYSTINLSYPSRRMSIAQLGDFLQQALSLSPSFNEAGKVHFVTHSMGGLLARYFLHQHRPANLGRVVMLCPPNKGSEFADFMMESRALKRVFNRVWGPAGCELCTTHKHVSEKVDFPLGIIAGGTSLNPLAPWILNGHDGRHDGVVPVERTKIGGMTDHIVVRATHTLMVFNPLVMRQAAHFLRNGRFEHTL